MKATWEVRRIQQSWQVRAASSLLWCGGARAAGALAPRPALSCAMGGVSEWGQPWFVVASSEGSRESMRGHALAPRCSYSSPCPTCSTRPFCFDSGLFAAGAGLGRGAALLDTYGVRMPTCGSSRWRRKSATRAADATECFLARQREQLQSALLELASRCGVLEARRTSSRASSGCTGDSIIASAWAEAVRAAGTDTTGGISRKEKQKAKRQNSDSHLKVHSRCYIFSLSVSFSPHLKGYYGLANIVWFCE